MTMSSSTGAITGTPTAASTATTYTVTATDANGATATAAFSLAVASSSQTITFAPATPLNYGAAPIALAATGGASDNPVTFSIVSGPGTLSGTNNSTLTITGAGTIVIAANQAGNASYSAATQVTASVVVNQAALTIRVNPVTSVYGVPFPTFAGTVAGVEGADGITATYSTTATPTSPVGGEYSIVATLLDPNSRLGNYELTNIPATLTITQANPVVALQSSMNPVLLLNPVALTATLTGVTVPTGSVSFLDGTTPLGAAPVTNGTATLAVTILAVGTHSITAVYSGDTNFAVAASAPPISEVVQDFSLAISASAGSNSVSAPPGGTATYRFTVSPVDASTFPAAVTFSASGLPSGASYIFSPAVLAAGSGSSNPTLTIQLPPTTLAANQAGKRDSNVTHKLAPLALALLLLPCAGRARRAGRQMSWYVVLLMVLGFSALAGLSGCGANGSGYFGQSQHTYTVTVTGTSGQLSHSTTVKLTVQ
jgi:hypothetical protein